MSLTCTYTTTESSTPVTVTYDTYADLKTNLTQNSSYRTILKTVTLSGSGTDTNTNLLFFLCSSLTSLDLSNLDTSNVTNMDGMFYRCLSLTSLDVSNLDTSNVTSMNSMFNSCSSLTSLDVSNFDTFSVTDMSDMFGFCSSLTSLDLSNLNTSNVTFMGYMFSGCSSLTSLDVSNFDTSNVTNMCEMFDYCSSLTTIYCNDDWNTGYIEYSDDMFTGCTSLVGAISYDSSKVDINYANPTTGYFTKISEIHQIIKDSALYKIRDESALHTLPTASTDVLGGVMVDGITITATNGVISAVGGTGTVESVNGKTGVVVLSASDLGLGNVENKSSETIRGELTSTDVTTALGYTPPTTNTTYSAGTGLSLSGTTFSINSIVTTTADTQTLTNKILDGGTY